MLGVALAGCSTPTEESVSLEVYSWWQEDSEEAAFNQIKRIHHDRHSNVAIENLGEATSNATRGRMAARMLAGAPPATFQANLGADLLRWTVVETREDRDDVRSKTEESRLIQGLSMSLANPRFAPLTDGLRDGLRENLTIGNSAPFGVPINVHRLNVLYYRPDALADFQKQPGNADKSFLDLGTLCPEGEYDPDASAYDLGDIEIAIGAGTDQGWTLALLTLENILPAIVARHLGDPAAVRKFYVELFRGERPDDGSAYLREALVCVQYLSKWFHRVRVPATPTTPENWIYDTEFGWADAVDRVRLRNGATFTVMGDWASGLLTNELAGAPDAPPEIKSQAFPGTEGLFVFTSDTFAFPRNTEHAADAADLLETIASEDTQIAFSKAKGSIPALRNANLGRLNEWQRAAARDFDETEHLLATSGYFPPSYPQGDFHDALRDMTDWNVVRAGASEENVKKRSALVDAALREFTDHEPLLAAWQARLEQGDVKDGP